VGERRNRFIEERERFTVALGGRLVAYCGGAGGGEAGGGSSWRLERWWREKEERGLCRKKKLGRLVFFYFWT